MKRRLPQLDLPTPRKRLLSAQERELWRSLMEIAVQQRVEENIHLADEAAIAPEKPVKKKLKKAAQPEAMSTAARTRIRKGKLTIDATLDLHGLTVEVAYRALVRFVARMQGETGKLVLVITGKGRAPQSGILRAQLPHWLEIAPLSEQVGAYSTALPTHGGDGAWYIHIRKRSKAGV